MSKISLLKNRIANTKAVELIYIPVALLPVFILINRVSYLSIFTFIVLLLISFYHFFRKRVISGRHLGIVILFLIISLYLFFSYFISNQTFLNLFNYGFLRFDGNFFFSYIPFIIFAIPFLNYRKALKIYFRMLFTVFVFFSVIGFFEYSNGVTGFTIRIDDYYVGPMFVALNNSHNATGSVLAIVCIFALAFFIKSGNTQKIPYGFISLLCFVALFMTKSRGSLVAFIIGVFFLLLIGSGTFLKFLRNILIIMAAMVPLVFITGTFGRIIQIIYIYDQSALTRFELWDKAIYLLKRSPVMGIGFARYNDVPWNYDEVPLSGDQGLISLYTSENFVFNDTNAHSSYLHFLAEIGIVGLVLFMLFWVFCLIIFLKAYRQANNVFSKQVYLAVIGGIITLFFLSISENYMTAPTVMLCLATITSLAIGLSGTERFGEVSE